MAGYLMALPPFQQHMGGGGWEEGDLLGLLPETCPPPTPARRRGDSIQPFLMGPFPTRHLPLTFTIPGGAQERKPKPSLWAAQ